EAFAAAICTTDSRIKVATTSVPIEDADGTRAFRVSGVAKRVGMIHPRMATMLAAILTDAPAQPATLDAILRAAASTTWNQLSVDGDTSTNDTVFLLASGAAGGPAIQPGSPSGAALARAVEAVARDLARQQAADGEGATTLLTCQVSGAREDAEARALARSVVSSSLVKAAVHGRDPNWGRIAAAAGNAGIPIDPDRLRIAIAGTVVVVHGGGRRLTEWLARLGVGSAFEGGLRVTDPAALEVATAVLRGVVNSELVSALRDLGVDAVGLSGVDGGLLIAERVSGMGLVAHVVGVRRDLVDAILVGGQVPVVAPLARDEDGLVCNVNADDAAAGIAAGLGARQLVLLTDVDGVRDGAGGRLDTLTIREA